MYSSARSSGVGLSIAAIEGKFPDSPDTKTLVEAFVLSGSCEGQALIEQSQVAPQRGGIPATRTLLSLCLG